MEEEKKIPNHIAIILDGNGRWAKKRGMPRSYGHVVGCDNLEKMCNVICDRGVKYLTVYAFSTENWKRPQEEVSTIMGLLEKYLLELLRDMDKNRVKFCFFGDLTRLSPALQAEAAEAVERSKQYEGVQVNFCLNYGGRAELLRAAQRCAERGLDWTEENLSANMYSAGIPDPELVIRPGGEMRLSNFLLWQCAYSELYFCDTLWPDFTRQELDKAIIDYQRRDRRFGGVK